jgi:PAS domain S-box-containing protein
MIPAAMVEGTSKPLDGLSGDTALRVILEGTAAVIGERFFRALVENLGKAMHTQAAWVTEYLEDSQRLRALAFWMNGKWIEHYEHALEGTPCQRVVQEANVIHYPERILEFFPNEPDLKQFGIASYLGAPLLDLNNKVIGHLAVMDPRPLPAEPRAWAIFKIFAARAAAELNRIRSEAQVREREEKLGRIFASAMDAIIELDENLTVTLVNPAAERTFNCAAGRLLGLEFADVLAPESAARLKQLASTLDAAGDAKSLWIPGGLTVQPLGGAEFPAEASLATFESARRKFFTLVLRNVNERLEAERRIERLSAEASYLRQELGDAQNFGEIVGRSPALHRVMAEVQQVAFTDATVLILGETGTGKELFARAIHAASRRRNSPLIKVNCAALPAALIESEFFGHEKGAFTGATSRREGRFALADGGTILLDEIGELPLELQAKLLRVLQEGEFEPVGSGTTRKVDVRVIAATNRDLAKRVDDGTFRADLFYRLNVFPIHIPPLRERAGDVALLAAAFARRFATRMGRTVHPLSEDSVQRLESYTWPGNVRELANVIERAVILGVDGSLNLDRALPEAPRDPEVSLQPDARRGAAARICTVREFESMERENLRLALDACGWKISGDQGAAHMLGINPSTLRSRMKVLGLERQGA